MKLPLCIEKMDSTLERSRTFVLVKRGEAVTVGVAVGTSIQACFDQSNVAPSEIGSGYLMAEKKRRMSRPCRYYSTSERVWRPRLAVTSLVRLRIYDIATAKP